MSPDLVTIIILCSLGNGYCTFGFLIFLIIGRNFLYYSLYILTEKSLKHLCSIRAWVPVSVCLFFLSSVPPSLPLSLSLSYHRLQTARSRSIKGPQHTAFFPKASHKHVVQTNPFRVHSSLLRVLTVLGGCTLRKEAWTRIPSTRGG